jgi:tetratricopeptide (TPR) repeat protein
MQALNPYIVGNAVGGSPAFVGREDILQEVYTIFNNPEQNAILLHGQRRIGKTSILRQLETELLKKDDFYPVFFDLLGKVHQPVEQIVQDLANDICKVLGKEKPQLGKEKPQLGEVSQTFFRDTWLPDLLADEKKSLVLLFDEFDALDDDFSKKIRSEFFRYLHDLLAIDREKLKFVFVIGRNVGDLTQIALSLFKEIPTKQVSLLNNEDTFKLIGLVEANQTLNWSTRAKNTVWQLTQGHPYLTQQLCYCIWEQLHKDNVAKIPKVLPKHIEQAIPDVLERSEGAINWLWGGLEAAQKVFISAIAEAGDKSVNQAQLDNLLSTIGIKISVPALADAPKSLQDSWDLITEDDKKGYHFKVELLRRLVAKYKPLHSVKNELNRLEPEANNYYQEATQLYEEKKLDEALDELGRVLRLNPNHIEASQLQANILLELDKLEEASNQLKKLFEDHPDEARPLLVQTLWNIAQSAKREGEELKVYEEILQFDNHVDAKKEIRKIWKCRAERALRDEDCKEAINAYQQAGLKNKASEIKKKCFWDKYKKIMIQSIVSVIVFFISYLTNAFKWNIDIPWWVWGSGLGIIAFFITGKLSFKRRTRDEY